MNSLFQSKFVQLLKTFSVDELKGFERWLASPWCNSNKNLSKLLEKISKYYPDFDHPKYTKEKLFKQILPTGKYSDRRINNLLSEAFQAAEKFMIFQRLSDDQQLQTDLLTQELQNRHLEDWFFKESDSEIARLEAKAIKDWEDHVALLKLHRRIYHHPNQKPRMQPGSPTIVKMGEQLDLLFLLEKGAIINEKISRTRLLKDETHDVIDELAIWNQAATNVQHPSIDLYKLRLNYEESKLLEQFNQLKTSYFDKSNQLNSKENKIHLLSLINDTLLLHKKGFINERQVLTIYKFGVQKGFLLKKNELTYNTFYLIVALSNFIKDFEYSDNFIKEYTPKLNPSFREDAFSWAQGHKSYHKGNLKESLDYLISFQFRSQFFNLMSKILATMVYFDLFLTDSSYQDFLFTYLDSFEKWLTREKMRSISSKKSYLLFVQTSRALAKYHLSPNKDYEKIKALINTKESMQARTWLKIKLISTEKGRSI